jgi:predicted Zn-dependent peptidase
VEPSVQLKNKTVPEEELRRSKDQLKGSLMVSLESSTARMSNLARQEMYFDHFQDLDELIEKIEAVTADDLQALAQEFFKTESIAVTALGNLSGLKISRDQLSCSGFFALPCVPRCPLCFKRLTSPL